MIWAKDAKLFFIKAIYKNHCVALPTELCFKEVLVKKGEHIRLNYISIWYYSYSLINLTIFLLNLSCIVKKYIPEERSDKLI